MSDEHLVGFVVGWLAAFVLFGLLAWAQWPAPC